MAVWGLAYIVYIDYGAIWRISLQQLSTARRATACRSRRLQRSWTKSRCTMGSREHPEAEQSKIGWSYLHQQQTQASRTLTTTVARCAHFGVTTMLLLGVTITVQRRPSLRHWARYCTHAWYLSADVPSRSICWKSCGDWRCVNIV